MPRLAAKCGAIDPAQGIPDFLAEPEIKVARVKFAEIPKPVGFRNAWAFPRPVVVQCPGFSASPSLMPTASSRLSRVHNVVPGARRVAASRWASM